MKLIDELQSIEKSKAIEAWPNTVSQIADLMRERAKGPYYGAILVSAHSKQIEVLLVSWATEQGLEITPTHASFGTPAYYLAWGQKPIVIGNCDAEIMPNGTLRLAKKEV